LKLEVGNEEVDVRGNRMGRRAEPGNHLEFAMQQLQGFGGRFFANEQLFESESQGDVDFQGLQSILPDGAEPSGTRLAQPWVTLETATGGPYRGK